LGCSLGRFSACAGGGRWAALPAKHAVASRQLPVGARRDVSALAGWLTGWPTHSEPTAAARARHSLITVPFVTNSHNTYGLKKDPSY
jgi:hypothetical protein